MTHEENDLMNAAAKAQAAATRLMGVLNGNRWERDLETAMAEFVLAAASVRNRFEEFTMDKPICEMCGENEATLKLAECAACDDCFAQEVRAALKPLLGRTCCCNPVWCGDSLAICLEPHGVEHSHN